MITFPIIALFCTYVGLSVVAVYALHVAQLCEDQATGLLSSHRPTRSLLAQKKRAERTAARCFIIGILLAVILVSTLEFPFV